MSQTDPPVPHDPTRDPAPLPSTTPGGAPPTSDTGLDTGPGTGPAPVADEGQDPLRFSRTSGAFGALVVTVVLIVLLVIFIFQNTASVPISFLFIDGHAPLAAALLIATAAGMAIVALVGGLRILQLRHRVKRETKRRKNA